MQNTRPTLPIFDLYDVWYEPFWHKPWFWPVITSFFILFFLIIVIVIIKKRRKKVVILDPWDWALQKFDELVVNEFRAPEMHKQFYFTLTAILKDYFSKRYSLELTSKTDEEVIEIICASDFPQSLQSSLKSIFHGAQYIKFAKQDVVLEKMHQDLKNSKRFVRETIPQ